jgi:2-polyprenyl-6-methoxyphenol hydroxylase-like FAD-dependent oxidoreductase
VLVRQGTKHDAEASAVALLGDGSSMAMAGARTLDRALADYPGDHAHAFRVYEARHRREVDSRHRRTPLVASLMVSRSRRGLAVRNTIARAIGRGSRRHSSSESAALRGDAENRRW